MDKIKAFFEKKVVKIVEAVVIAVASAGLIIGGITVETVAKIPAVTGGIIVAIEALITFIQAITTKE